MIIRSEYKIYKRYREDIWGNLVKYPHLNAFLSLRLVLFSKGLYKKKREDFARNALFKTKIYTPAALVFLNKQKLRYFYSNLNYKQLKNIFLVSQKSKFDLVDSFIGLLESRIDTVLYRLNFINHMREANQILMNSGVFVNNICITKSNTRLLPGDIINIQNKEYQKNILLTLARSNTFLINFPAHLEVNYNTFTGIFLYMPREEETFFPFNVDCNLAMQYFKDIT